MDADDSLPKLQYGRTPWDDLPRDELLREVQRLYAAVLSARSALDLCRGREASGFWSRPGDGRSSTDHGGTGGRTLTECELALERSPAARYDSESVYRSFFRYAVDLLFSPALGFQWTACDGCPHFIGGPDLLGKPCPECRRAGRDAPNRRPLEWKDLTPAP